MRNIIVLFFLSGIFFWSCGSGSNKSTEFVSTSEIEQEIKLPEGFKLSIIAENYGKGRQIAVNSNGDIYITLAEPVNGKTIVGLRDSDGDGKADLIRYFGNLLGTGIDIYNRYIYVGAEGTVVRYQLSDGKLMPDTIPEIVVSPIDGLDASNPISLSIDLLGNLYVGIGTSSVACASNSDDHNFVGEDPCSKLVMQAGVWKLNANILNQKIATVGERFATGIRKAEALTWNNSTNKLYAVQEGRGELIQRYPELYSDEEGDNLPAEEFLLIEEGDDFGWPYCYYDPFKIKKVLSPEYGGNNELVGRCEFVKDPILTFPAHLSPNNLKFYHGEMFPAKYNNGAFVTFKGIANSSDESDMGAFVAFVPFNGVFPIGQWEVFAKGTKGKNTLGIAFTDEGAMLLSDMNEEKLWIISHEMKKTKK